MALIEWRKEFEIGMPAVDLEHRELIRLLNALHRALGTTPGTGEVQGFLGEVFARISAHFALEESIMRRDGYDQYEAHKQEHERLLDEIRDIMDAYDAGRYLDLEDELGDALRHWFGDHFATADARLHGQIGDRHR